MNQLEKFFNDGFGWICRTCAEEQSDTTDNPTRSRLLREGESEGKVPRLSTPALARWKDRSRQRLECPNCGATESMSTE